MSLQQLYGTVAQQEALMAANRDQLWTLNDHLKASFSDPIFSL